MKWKWSDDGTCANYHTHALKRRAAYVNICVQNRNIYISKNKSVLDWTFQISEDFKSGYAPTKIFNYSDNSSDKIPTCSSSNNFSLGLQNCKHMQSWLSSTFAALHTVYVCLFKYKVMVLHFHLKCKQGRFCKIFENTNTVLWICFICTSKINSTPTKFHS